MSPQHSGTRVRMGVPLETVTGAVADAEGAGETRIYLEVPIALLRAAMPEVAGHQ
jgi:hypothetical protein